MRRGSPTPHRSLTGTIPNGSSEILPAPTPSWRARSRGCPLMRPRPSGRWLSTTVAALSAAEPDLDSLGYYVYIHSMDKDERALQEACSRVVAECACEGLRRTARAVTQHYEDALAPSGLRATQFPIVVALASAGPLPVTRLAQALVLDRTTLTRNMRALLDRGLIAVTGGE